MILKFSQSNRYNEGIVNFSELKGIHWTVGPVRAGLKQFALPTPVTQCRSQRVHWQVLSKCMLNT